MKKLLLPLLFALMMISSSCSVAKVEPPAPSRSIYTFDYTEVSNTYGVGFTESDAVAFDYDAVGTVSIYEYGGFVKKEFEEASKPTKFKDFDGIYGPTPKKATNKKYVYQYPNAQKGLAALAQKAKEMGGDYVINLHISYSEGIYYSLWDQNIEYYYYTGMVVKRRP